MQRLQPAVLFMRLAVCQPLLATRQPSPSAGGQIQCPSSPHVQQAASTVRARFEGRDYQAEDRYHYSSRVSAVDAELPATAAARRPWRRRTAHCSVPARRRLPPATTSLPSSAPPLQQ